MSTLRILAWFLALAALCSVAIMGYRYGNQAAYVSALERGVAEIAAEHNDLLARQAADRVQLQDYLSTINRLNKSKQVLRDQLNQSSGCASHAIEPDVVERVQSNRDQNSHGS